MRRFDRLLVHPPTNSIKMYCSKFASRTPSPLAYSRAVIQCVLFAEYCVPSELTPERKIAGEVLHEHLLMYDLQELVLGGDDLLDPQNWNVEIPSDPRYQLARKIDNFVQRAVDVCKELANFPSVWPSVVFGS